MDFLLSQDVLVFLFRRPLLVVSVFSVLPLWFGLLVGHCDGAADESVVRYSVAGTSYNTTLFSARGTAPKFATLQLSGWPGLASARGSGSNGAIGAQFNASAAPVIVGPIERGAALDLASYGLPLSVAVVAQLGPGSTGAILAIEAATAARGGGAPLLAAWEVNAAARTVTWRNAAGRVVFDAPGAFDGARHLLHLSMAARGTASTSVALSVDLLSQRGWTRCLPGAAAVSSLDASAQQGAAAVMNMTVGALSATLHQLNLRSGAVADEALAAAAAGVPGLQDGALAMRTAGLVVGAALLAVGALYIALAAMHRYQHAQGGQDGREGTATVGAAAKKAAATAGQVSVGAGSMTKAASSAGSNVLPATGGGDSGASATQRAVQSLQVLLPLVSAGFQRVGVLVQAMPWPQRFVDFYQYFALVVSLDLTLPGWATLPNAVLGTQCAALLLVSGLMLRFFAADAAAFEAALRRTRVTAACRRRLLADLAARHVSDASQRVALVEFMAARAAAGAEWAADCVEEWPATAVVDVASLEGLRRDLQRYDLRRLPLEPLAAARRRQ
jgi:hypothetical protein